MGEAIAFEDFYSEPWDQLVAKAAQAASAEVTQGPRYTQERLEALAVDMILHPLLQHQHFPVADKQ